MAFSRPAIFVFLLTAPALHISIKAHNMRFKIEKAAFLINILLPALLVLSLIYPSPYFLSTAALLALNALNFYYRHIQKRHTLLANFGLFALLRYLIESLGPEFRQYLYSSDTEEKPFNRTERSDVYKKAKNEETNSSFGSLLNFDGKAFKLKHSFYPAVGEPLPFSLAFGEERGIKNPCVITNPLLIGGMSYGSLGKRAVRALARGAKKAGLLMNTGEGGYPKYHLMEGCDLIFQMGAAKFGVRTHGGRLDPEKLEAIARQPQVKMIEIKFSQGGKPGKGGILPKEKITPEIAELRHIPMGKDLASPPRHIECEDAASTVKFIRRIQEISGLPAGIKFCLGRERELKDLLAAMKKENSYPDYIAIDGSEGGTGAAPKTFMDDLGYPLMRALPVVTRLLKEAGVQEKFKILCSGKLILAGKQMMALGMGADAFYTARGFLLALGCIQALRCHTNSCPTGITTHSPRLMKGLDIEEKSERVKNYAINLAKHHQAMLQALGLKSFSELNESHVLPPIH